MTEPDRPGSSASRQAGEASLKPSSPSPQPPAATERGPSASHSPDAIEQQHQQGPLPPQFQPLFTLVTDSTTRATHHPRVHYVFSDDDPDILTEALAQRHSSLTSAEHEPSPMHGSSGSGAPPDPAQERAIVLDLVPKEDGSAGYEVAWASSLSADWAVTSAQVSRMEDDTPAAPGAQDDGAGSANLMLRIEGVGIEGGSGASSASRQRGGKGASPLATGDGGELQLSTASGTRSRQAAVEEDYGLLIDEFEKRMGVLRKVVSAGEDRQRKVATDMDQTAQEQAPPRLEVDDEAGHVAEGD